MLDYDIDNCEIILTKHFRNDYMRKWGWDIYDLREAIKNAYKIDKFGKSKYEIYTKKSGNKKIIFVYDDFDKTILVIS